MTDQPDNKDIDSFEKLLQKVASDTCGHQVLVSGYVAVVESVSVDDGTQELITITDPHTPPWDAYGMLQWATEQQSSFNTDEDD